MDKEKTCCFTGHRPDKLPWGEKESDPRCRRLKESIAQAAEEAYESGIRHFISGMARGADLDFAEAVLARYQSILDRCDYETLVQHNYDRFCMLRRNRYMVDRSVRLIAVYNGVPKGGTFQTLQYAMKKGLSIHILDLEDFL